MRCGSTAKVLAECKLKYYRISECCRSVSGEGRQGAQRSTFREIIKTDTADLPSVDSKPEYHTVLATVAQIDPDTNLYYNACPENNRKVCSHHIQHQSASYSAL